jgi:hypothetical protein
MTKIKGRTVENTRSRVLGQELESKLATYVVAAGAVGIGVLALPQPAQAQVVYTPAHVEIKPATTYDLDLNNDGTTDFSFADNFMAHTLVGSLIVAPFASNGGALGNAVLVNGSAIFSPVALNRGAKIGGSRQFYGSCIGCNSSVEIMAWADPFADFGYWFNVQNRYLGLKLMIDHQPHYGWARLTVQEESKHRIAALLTGYAYEATPDKPILAGQTSGSAVDFGGAQGVRPSGEPEQRPISQAMPSPSLGMLALGAQGLPLWRTNSPGAQ